MATNKHVIMLQSLLSSGTWSNFDTRVISAVVRGINEYE